MCPKDAPPTSVANPIFAGTGNKYQREVDYVGPGLLSVVRHYNSMLKTWVHNYLMRVRTDGTTAVAVRPDGRTLVFTGSGVGAWRSNATVAERLTRLSTADSAGPAWQLVTADETIELYDASGLPLSITLRGGRGVRMAYSGGALQSVADDFGRSLSFAYDSQGRLASVSAPGGETVGYGYGSNGHLATVTYADNTTRQYLYENAALPYALTGLIDQNGQRFASWSYDSLGRAVSSEHAGGVERFSLAFDPGALSVMVTDPLGAQRLLQHQNISGRLVFGGSTQPCANCTGDAAGTTVNGIGKVTQSTDFAGVANQYSYDEVRLLPTGVTRAVGRAEAQSRTIAWDPAFRLPALVTEAGRTTAYTYDALGNKLTETVTDLATSQARTWQWTYTSQGLVDSMTDPKGATWRYGYDSTGNRTSITNPLGQQTSYAHDGAGRVTSQTEPNGLVTTYAYDARGRLTQQSRGGEASSYSYTPTGQLAAAVMPNGYQVSYSYDAAQRLVAAVDNRGATIQYTLDAAGNRVREEVKDASGAIALVTSRIINNLNRVAAIQGSVGQTTALAYDANGEPVAQTDPLNQTTRQTLDGLRRPVATTFADNASAAQAWNQLDQLTQVTDPKGVATSYQTNAFGEVVGESGPDIGAMSFQRDADGAVIRVTDAVGNTSAITRDALGRPVQVSDTGSAETFLRYDTLGNLLQIDDGSGSTSYQRDLLGRVTGKTQSVNDNPANPTKYAVQYGYDAAGLASIRYPSGLTVLLRRNAGRVTGIDVQPLANPSGKLGPVSALVSGLTYSALGAPQSWTFMNGDKASRSFDADGRMVRSEIASYSYDAAGRITSITQNLWTQRPPASRAQATGPLAQEPVTWSAGYDRRNRLTAFTRGGVSSSYSYDPNSNRLAAVETIGGDLDLESRLDADNLTLSVSQASKMDDASNRLLGFNQTLTLLRDGVPVSSVTGRVNYGLDANGAMTSDGLRTFVYDGRRRLAKVELLRDGESASVSYLHNGLGQRVFKGEPRSDRTTPDEATLGQGFISWLRLNFGWMFDPGRGQASIGMAFVYDEQGNLLGEYDNGSASGRGRTEYIWLPIEGGPSMLVGMFRKGEFFAVHADHLGTPRLVTDGGNKPVWQWPYSAFGNNKPIGVLTATTTKESQARLKATAPAVEVNLRFPGQYFDEESNLSYNYFRSYSATTGRYSQPDPIGLAGGWNRFGYVGGNPLSFTDPTGLQVFVCNRAVDGFPFTGNHSYLYDSTTGTAQGMRGSSKSGMASNERGTSGDACNKVDGSEGKEKQVMDFMRRNQNAFVWIPGMNDCHSAVDRALGANGLPTPGAPGGRMGPLPGAPTPSYPSLPPMP